MQFMLEKMGSGTADFFQVYKTYVQNGEMYMYTQTHIKWSLVFF
jgi:hypothetical protein